MKGKCPHCGRMVGIQSDGTFSKHRSKRGARNRKEDSRHPVCSGTREQYDGKREEFAASQAAVPHKEEIPQAEPAQEIVPAETDGAHAADAPAAQSLEPGGPSLPAQE